MAPTPVRLGEQEHANGHQEHEHVKTDGKPNRPRVGTRKESGELLPSANGLSDQYSDGKAAKVWQLYIGESTERTTKYKAFLVKLLKDHNCSKILDAACGTGVDSVMLLEEGFNVVSADASDKMLKTAFEARWNRRKENMFDNWEIYEGNWLTLNEDITPPPGGFDALLCMGNSFAHLPDVNGDQTDHKLAIENFYRMLKPGGILVIDHRNYDYILDNGKAPKNNIYYNSKYIKDIRTSILYVENHPTQITLDYEMDVSSIFKSENSTRFRLTYYPHRLRSFVDLLKNSFGENAKHSIYGDFKPLNEIPDPAFFIHTIEKPKL